MRQIQVYELRVPPKAIDPVSVLVPTARWGKSSFRGIQNGGEGGGRKLTRVVEQPLLGPMLDHHGQRAHARIDLDVRLDQTRVLQR